MSLIAQMRAIFAQSLVPVYLLIVRLLIARSRYQSAERLLRTLADRQPAPDVLWAHADVLRRAGAGGDAQLSAWQRFVVRASEDHRAGRAWLAIGDLLAEAAPWGDGQAAVQAYERAEQAGLSVPRLDAYRLGRWEDIAALRTHSDFAFPVVVVLDLEVDPAPGAAPGERVFEVGAVRMKGQTQLAEYQSFVRRGFRPAKMATARELQQAPAQGIVAIHLRAFIGNDLLAGHNLRDFDAAHLDGMGVPVPQGRILDTLHIARLLYPDSLHHNLAQMCRAHRIPVNASDLHNALPDARACAALLYALGDKIVHRGEALLTGVRALVPSGSALDVAILRPRHVPADPTIPWSLDPAPGPAISLAVPAGAASSEVLRALSDTGEGDMLVELDDPDGAYVAALPSSGRSLVAVADRARVERMLAARAAQTSPSICTDTYVLADPDTLLCPTRMRAAIDAAPDDATRLLLFCHYQAAHNHDASALYPLRIPVDPADPQAQRLARLREELTRACCPDDAAHRAACPGAATARAAIAAHPVLLATHQALLHQKTPPPADLIVIDDAADLQTRLASDLAHGPHSAGVRATLRNPLEQAALARLEAQIAACARDYLPHPGFHERLPLRSLRHYLESPPATPNATEAGQGATPLYALTTSGPAGEVLAEQLRKLCAEAEQGPASPEHVHAYWLDIWFGDGARPGAAAPAGSVSPAIEDWAIRGVNMRLPEVFKERCWAPYRRHIVCGPSLVLGAAGSTFLERALGLPTGLPRRRDSRPRAQVWLPLPEAIPPAGFLGRHTWALQVGAFLYAQSKSSAHALVATLSTGAVGGALAEALRATTRQHGRRVLSRSLGWGTTQIAERLTGAATPVLAMVSPGVRRASLDAPVDVEISGTLRFLNTRDPLVAEQMRVFAAQYPADGPFDAYLLPQALHELKARLTSPASAHIVLDSRLLVKRYRDEVLNALRDGADVHFIERIPSGAPDIDGFMETLSHELEQRGLSASVDIPDEDLRLALRTLWDADRFRDYERVTPAGTQVISQRDVVRGALSGKDQLLIIPTGGGKSLCFQLPGVLLAETFPPKVTLVFSPLIALMRNQVETLNQKGVFSAIMLNSTLPPEQRKEHLRGIQRGDYSLIYVAPEQIYSSGLRRALEGRDIGLVAIDEAHCLSQWGHDFRTDYFAIKPWIDQRLCHGQRRDFPLLALTATARKAFEDRDDADRSDKASTVRDIIEKLGLVRKDNHPLDDSDVVMASTRRSELQFDVVRITPQPVQCLKCKRPLIIQTVGEVECAHCHARRYIRESEVRTALEGAKREELIKRLNDGGPGGLKRRWEQPPRGAGQRGLVYCAYQRTTEQVAEALRKRVPGLRIAAYHAGMEAPDRGSVQDRFTGDMGEDGLDVVVATNAFGMGIDVRRLGFVIHFDTPATLEAYYQEAGRAGRDPSFKQDERALCLLLYHPTDLSKQRFLARLNLISDHDVREVYGALCDLHTAVRQRADADGRDPAATTWGDEAREAPAPEGDSDELIVTDRDLAALSGIEEESVTTALYYLQYHTRCGDNPVLQRGETANRVWRLKLEDGYEREIERLPPDSPSWPLLRAFLESDDFRLREQVITSVSAADLSASLRWGPARLERELLNLAKRRIISYACDGRIRWTEGAAQARATLRDLERDLGTFLREADKRSRGELKNGNMAYTDLGAIRSEFLSTVPLPRFAHFLYALSRESAEPIRLFEHFARALKRPVPACYECRLWEGRGGRSINSIVKELFAELGAVLDRLESLEVSTEWQTFDILRVESNYHARQRLHRWLLLLDLLGVVRYAGDPAMGLALRLRLPQPDAPAKSLAIDLGTLRLKEAYMKHKLLQLESYAGLQTSDDRARFIDSYFFAEAPLIERLDPNMRDDLTADQRSVAALDTGFHVVEGPAGCGKTTILVEHVKRLVYQQQVPLERIMVTTHFKSAIGRIDRQLEVLREDGAVALASTVNAFGDRIFLRYRGQLRRDDGQPYYKEVPNLLSASSGKRGSRDEGQDSESRAVSVALTRVHAGTWPKDAWPEGLALPSVSSAYRPNAGIEKHCIEAINVLRQYGVFPTCSPTKDDILGVLGADPERRRQYGAPELYAVYVTYLALRGERAFNYYTFDDQILFALALLRTRPEIKHAYQRHFEHVIVDEFQDFTPAAAALFQEVAGLHNNVLVFGDRDQDIRAKRTSAGALFNDLRPMDSCGRSHALAESFRSTQRILDVATAVRNWNEAPQDQWPQLRAARGIAGAKPVLLRIDSEAVAPADSEIQAIVAGRPDGQLLWAMVEAALEQMEQIDVPEGSEAPDDRAMGSVGLIVPERDWQLPIEQLLRARGVSFSILEGQPRYQLPHVANVLAYLRLIVDPRLDEEVGRILRQCVVPYLEAYQIKALRGAAQGRPLLDVLRDEDALREAKVTPEQRVSLKEHLDVVVDKGFDRTTRVQEVANAIRDIPEGPIQSIADDEDKTNEVDNILRQRARVTVGDALADIGRHIGFLENNRGNTGFVLTTVDNAKSQEFDSVMLLGAHALSGTRGKRRLYVAITRARDELYVLCDGSVKLTPLLRSAPEECWQQRTWPPTEESAIEDDIPF